MSSMNFTFRIDDCDRPKYFHKLPSILTLIRSLLLGLFIIVLTQISTPQPASAQKWDVFPYKLQYSKNVQRQWKRIGCYNGPIDGAFGPKSLAAKKRWLDELDGSVPGWVFRSRESVLIFLKEQPKKFCSGIVDGTDNRKSCNKNTVVSDWLKKDNNKAVRQVRKALDNLSSSFGTVFAITDVDGTEETSGTEKVTTKDLFLAAKLRLASLIERNSLASNNTCLKCSVLADWSVLKRLAKPAGGILKSNINQTASIKVDEMDEKFVKGGANNIENIRNYIAHINNDPLGADIYRERLKKEVGVLVDAMIANRPSGNSLLGVKKNYRCVGFDGFGGEFSDD